MNLRDVLLHALNEQDLMGVAISRDSLDQEAIKVFEDNGVDIDGVIEEVQLNEGGHLDLY